MSEGDSEDFRRAINEINTSDEDEHNHSGDEELHNGATDSDMAEFQHVMAIPAPEAPAHVLRTALGKAQQAYRKAWKDAQTAKQELAMLTAKLPPRMQTRALCTTSPLDASIIKEAKKYCLFYHFWIPSLLLPVGPRPDVDLLSPARWRTPESKAIANKAKFYQIMPKELHNSIMTLDKFDQLFASTVSSERSNILKPVKDSAALLFAPFKLDSALFGDRECRGQDQNILALLKKNVDDKEYTPFAPILFADPHNVVAKDFLKSDLLVQIARILIFSKGVLLAKKRGGPKGRGQQMGVCSVTEGFVSLLGILARYLLSHNAELCDKGPNSGIEYQKNFKFIIEHLHNPRFRDWALEVMDFINQGVFGDKLHKPSEDLSSLASLPLLDAPCTWEDELLDELENHRSSDAAPAIVLTTTATTVVPQPQSHDPPQSDPTSIMTNSRMMSSLSVTPSTPLTSVAMSTTSQLDVEVAQLSLGSDDSVPSRLSSASTSRRTKGAASGRREPVAIYLPAPPAENAPSLTTVPIGEAPQCMTHTHARAGKSGQGRSK